MPEVPLCASLPVRDFFKLFRETFTSFLTLIWWTVAWSNHVVIHTGLLWDHDPRALSHPVTCIRTPHIQVTLSQRGSLFSSPPSMTFLGGFYTYTAGLQSCKLAHHVSAIPTMLSFCKLMENYNSSCLLSMLHVFVHVPSCLLLPFFFFLLRSILYLPPVPFTLDPCPLLSSGF